MENLQTVYTIIDEMLASTTERNIVPVGELQNWMLDMRSALMKLESELEPVPA
jgi:hypothetical protein